MIVLYFVFFCMGFAIVTSLELSSAVPFEIGFAGKFTPPKNYDKLPYYDLLRASKVKKLSAITVGLCDIDWANYKSDPAHWPMFSTLAPYSKCSFQGKSTTFGELEMEYYERGCHNVVLSDFNNHGCAPSGLVFHQSRCGSTLTANALAAYPDSVSYSESAPPSTIMNAGIEGSIDREDWSYVLRIIMAAMGRPIAAYEANLPIPKAPADWKPKNLFFKFQTTFANNIHIVQEAFPGTPWIFIMRNGTEILMSQVRNALNPPKPDGSPSEHLFMTDTSIRSAPCLRLRDHWMSSIMRHARVEHHNEFKNLAAETVCASYLSIHAERAITHAIRNRFFSLKTEFAALGVDSSDLTVEIVSNGNLLSKYLSTKNIPGGGYVNDLIQEVGGVLKNKVGNRGVIGGRGQGLFIDYSSMTDSIEFFLSNHFGIPTSPSYHEVLADVYLKYSKARVGGERLLGSMTENGTFIADTETKQNEAWPFLRRTAAEIMEPFRNRCLAFNPPNDVLAKMEPGRTITYGNPPLNDVYFTPEEVVKSLEDYDVPFEASESLIQRNHPHPIVGYELEGYETSSGQTDGASNPTQPTSKHPLPEEQILAVPVAELNIDSAVPLGDFSSISEAVKSFRKFGLSPPGTLSALQHGLVGTGRGIDYIVPPAGDTLLPLGQGYPMLFPLSTILAEWSSDVVTPPPTYGRYSSIRRFDFQIPAERAEAEEYRRAEVPFVVYNVPSLEASLETFATDDSMLKVMGPKEYSVEINDNNHFMYYAKGAKIKDPNYVPPTRDGKMTVPAFLKVAHEVDERVHAEEEAQLPSWWFAEDAEAPALSGRAGISETVLPPKRNHTTLYYMRALGEQTGKQEDFINSRLKFFMASQRGKDPRATEESPFFIVDELQQRGIHCRFGMPGIIAESHLDGGRNFISMERGHKRYIISPPSECPNLRLYKSGPSARHSMVDWSEPQVMHELGNALAFEVIIGPGDVLYLPAFWFHYITSLDINVQCNSRSGTPDLYIKELQMCGFNLQTSERLGIRTNPDAPALQPRRENEAHFSTWSKFWPTENQVLPNLEGYLRSELKNMRELNPTLFKEVLLNASKGIDSGMHQHNNHFEDEIESKGAKSLDIKLKEELAKLKLEEEIKAIELENAGGGVPGKVDYKNILGNKGKKVSKFEKGQLKKNNNNNIGGMNEGEPPEEYVPPKVVHSISSKSGMAAVSYGFRVSAILLICACILTVAFIVRKKSRSVGNKRYSSLPTVAPADVAPTSPTTYSTPRGDFRLR